MNAFDEIDHAQGGWMLTPHACRHCLGRVLARQIDGVQAVRCAECDTHAVGEHHALCCCGTA